MVEDLPSKCESPYSMSLLNKKKRNRQKKKEKKDLHETEPLGKNDQTVFIAKARGASLMSAVLF